MMSQIVIHNNLQLKANSINLPNMDSFRKA